MAGSEPLNRRDFLRFGRRRDAHRLDLSGEQLFMKFVDARENDTVAEFLARLEADLQSIEELRLTGIEWLRREDLGARMGPVLSAFRARGGKVTFE